MLLVFVNYARFSKNKKNQKKKKKEIMLLLYTLNLVKTPQYLASKWQNHFPYVHKETL